MPDLLPPKLAELLELFDSLGNTDERVALLLDYAGRYREVSPRIATRPFPEEHRVQFCESEAYVWVIAQPDGTLRLHFAVENPSGVSAKALAAILESTLSGLRPEQIVTIPEDIVSRIFRQNMSMGKGMGLMSMIRTVKAFASRSVKDQVHQVE